MIRKKHTETIRAYTEWQVAITNNLPGNEIDRYLFQKQTLENSYRAEFAYYQARHLQLKNEIISLQQQLSPTGKLINKHKTNTLLSNDFVREMQDIISINTDREDMDLGRESTTVNC